MCSVIFHSIFEICRSRTVKYNFGGPNCKSEVRTKKDAGIGIPRVCSIVFIKHSLAIVSLAIVSVAIALLTTLRTATVNN